MGIIYIIIYGGGKLNWYLFDGRESWRINVKLAEDIKLQFKDNFKYKFKFEPKVKLLVKFKVRFKVKLIFVWW